MIPYRSVHFIGVLTPEMAGLALYTRQAEVVVSGSDDHADTLFTPVLQAAHVTLYKSFSPDTVPANTELVVVSRYYDEKHSEVVAATKAKIPVMLEAEYTKLVSERHKRVSVLGDYESRLIATWLLHVWHEIHQEVAGIPQTILTTDKSSAVYREASDWFVLPFSGFKRAAHTYEADFLPFESQAAIIPSIRYDYTELYSTLDEAYQAYYTFVKRVPRSGIIIGNNAYNRMKRLQSHLVDRHIETYGFERDATWHIRNIEVTDDTTTFSLARVNQLYGPFTIPCRGETALLAAVAVAALSLLYDMKIESVARALSTVPKVKRYMETALDKEGRVIIRDCADHPDNINQVFRSIREHYPDKKIWCVYQPASFLRTRAHYQDLQAALNQADTLYLGDITGYPKEKSEGLHARHLVSEMKQVHAHTYYFSDADEVARILGERVTSGDCILLLGEGACADTIIAHLFPPVSDES